ncbi:hypothetical protein BG006_005202 [Podila minutissima]|uniref:CID domain-containing protein n=1 Tax=Podila minutissima TaxID=64525 RepID=A0A9P5VMG6_9FUNG|nr:hypothetical protein BG006_005202 [Podila minutissima]
MSKELPPEVAEFDKELYNLFDSRAVSASKIDKLTKLAFKAAKYYKNIVYCLEKFITRCVPEYKLTGLYVLDSICRTSQSVKTKSSSSSGSFSGAEYVARFEKNIEALFTEFTKVQEDKEKEKVKRVVVLWERSSTFAPSTTENIRKKYFPLLETKGDRTIKADDDISTTTSTATTKEQEITSTPSTSETAANSVTNAASLISTLASLAQSSGSSTPTSSGSSSNGYNLSGWTSTSQPTSTAPSLLPGTSDPSSAEASAQALQTILATVFQVNSATAPGPPATSHLAPPPPLQSIYAPSFPSHAQLQGMLSSSIEAPNNNNSVPTNASAFMYGAPGATSTTAGGSPIVNGFGVPGYPGPGRRDPRSDPRLRSNGNEPNGGLAPSAFAGVTASGSPAFDTQALAQLSFLLKPRAQPPQAQGPPVPSPMELPKSDDLMGMNMHPARLGLLQGGVTAHGHRATGGPGGSGSSVPQGPRDIPRPLNSSNNNNNNNNIDDHPSDRTSRPPYQRHPLPPNPMLAQSGGRPKGLEVREDPQVGSDQIRVISRTLWVGGGFIPTISVQDLEAIFAPKGQIATCMINQAKFNAFIKMADRAQAERCKAELDRTTVQGEVMKVGWGCGFGPRDCFDYTSGTSVIPLDRLTDTDRRWLSNSVVGGFGPHEVIRGGVVIFEPNIESVEPDGREALPRKSRGFGGANATGMGRGGGDVGRGRGRGRGMDAHGGSEYTPSFRGGGGRGGHRGGHQGFEASAGGKRDFEHEGDKVASVLPSTTGHEERRDAKKSRWG